MNYFNLTIVTYSKAKFFISNVSTSLSNKSTLCKKDKKIEKNVLIFKINFYSIYNSLSGKIYNYSYVFH